MKPQIGPVTLSALASAVALGALLVLSPLSAAAHDGHHAVAADKVAFKAGPPTLPKGAEMAVLYGNPAEEGPFVMRFKFPADYVIPPHRHPREEHITVLSGGFGMSAGETFNSSAAPVLPTGSFIQIPIGTSHFAWTEEETIVQLNGIGPWGIEYLNPEDDPRNQ